MANAVVKEDGTGGCLSSTNAKAREKGIKCDTGTALLVRISQVKSVVPNVGRREKKVRLNSKSRSSFNLPFE